MKSVDRRSFNQLTMAALGGMVAGSTMGASTLLAEDEKKKDGKKKEVHVCRGLNTCKGTGIYGKSTCAGKGSCATAEYHACKGQNACKGQGGCGEHPGENKCKGMGKCAVPLKNKAWKAARANFEKRMKGMDKNVGKAPAANKTPQGNKELRAKVVEYRENN